MAPAAAADRLSYKSKGGMGAAAVGSLSATDLTAAPEKVAALSDDQLPDNLRKMSKEERKAYLTKQAETRKKLETQVVELSKKRDAWIAEHAATDKDSFDGRVFESVKKRAATVGVSY